jgi:hypothetical protein
MNWGPSKTVPVNNFAFGVDCFSYDPIRKIWFFGGIHNVDHSIGQLSYSYDSGNTWAQVGTGGGGLPLRHSGGDITAYYQNCVSDDGRYLTWLTSGSGILLPSFPYLNANAGAWSASSAFPGGIIQHVFWAQNDNRFIAVGLSTGGTILKAWSVDVDTDTWDVLALPGAVISANMFGASSPGDRIVASATQLWRTGSVSSAFYSVKVPWLNLTGLSWCPESFVFVAIADGKLWVSPNGVVWSQVITGFESAGALGGAVNGLGDIVVATFRQNNPDGIITDHLLIGTNSLREWQIIQHPQSFASGAYPTFGIYRARDKLAMLNNNTNCGIRASMSV